MKRTTIAILTLFLTLPLASCAQSKGSQQSSSQKPTKSILIKDAKNYIVGVEKKHDGYLPMYDSVAKQHLKLKLENVHRDKFSYLGDHKYFICSNFKGTNGKTYDIDTFMKWNGHSFKAIRRKVHKVNGKARYVWYKDGNVWKTESPKDKKKGQKTTEHPGH